MCEDKLCYLTSALGLAAFSFPLPLLLLGGIAIARMLSPWEWIAGALLVVVAAPTSFLLTAYFFVGLPLVAIVALLASATSRSETISRIVLVTPLALYLMWWIVAGAWMAACPNCGEGDNERDYVWSVGGLLLLSRLGMLLLTLEFGRAAVGKLLWRRPTKSLW